MLETSEATTSCPSVTFNHCALSLQQERIFQTYVFRCWINHLRLRELQELVTRVAVLPQVSQQVHSPQYIRSHTVSYVFGCCVSVFLLVRHYSVLFTSFGEQAPLRTGMTKKYST